MNIKSSNLSKILIVTLCSVFVIVLLTFFSIQPNKILGSVYDIDSAKNNLNKIKVGDSINYEINGYSDWKVIYVDKKNNTIEVVSKENLGEITLATKEDFENALDNFQEEANKYVDGKYAISARSVNRADLENFAFNQEFWNADRYNMSIAYTGGKIDFYDIDNFSNDYYYIPFVRFRVSNASSYNQGDEFIQDINGISKWFIIDSSYDSLTLIPQDPIKFDVRDYPNFIENGYDTFEVIFDGFRQYSSDVLQVGHVINYYGSGRITNYQNINNYYANKGINYKVIRGWFDHQSGSEYRSVNYEYEKYNSDYRRFECCYYETFKANVPVTKGFRPVVTLKLGDIVQDGKNADTNVSIGDNVNYNALGYQNWVVLSIDKDNNTAELVSGGVVKNIFLQGKNDFESYEEILQNEVDKFKDGDNVISARALEYSDLASLNKIGDKVNAKYWINSKKQFNRKVVEETSSPYSGLAFYNVGIMYYNINNLSIDKNWVSLYIAPGTNQNNAFILSSYNSVGELSFTAGLRPVIKVKLDQIEKLDNEAKNSVINSAAENDQKIIREQANNSNNNITNYGNGDENDNPNNNIDNNIKTNNFYSTFKDHDGNDNLVRYILIGLILLNIFIITQVILSSIIFKKMKKK